ncbi:Membrane-bound transcription factor site-1 protease [Oopsacas minuta]|uniref:Membrane-bound transcription factor site-1 protease n=1 Tax=Oopsacas minuta TaxID=111878 RepID=A0AAV7JHF7_9METZ|nr:Membrane-bound transcription factor site-1 protease [Oopsacas minuta]
MKTIKFFDENTQQWWSPVTGGSNIPALNDLLTQFGLAFSDRIYAGTYSLPDVTLDDNTKPRDFPYLSGSSLARYPSHARVLSVTLHDQVAEVTTESIKEVDDIAILALLEGEC